MPFTFKRLSIPDVVLVQAEYWPDERGFVLESFNEFAFASSGIMTNRFVQDKCSHSRRGVLRGLHYQKDPYAQAKLVMATRGEIFDVAVDMRRNSPTYGRWVAEVLSDQNHRMLYVPEGFAHGTYVQSDVADIVYKTSRDYSPENERGIIWNDPDINVRWPTGDPLLSEKDRHQSLLRDADNNFVWQKPADRR